MDLEFTEVRKPGEPRPGDQKKKPARSPFDVPGGDYIMVRVRHGDRTVECWRMLPSSAIKAEAGSLTLTGDVFYFAGDAVKDCGKQLLSDVKFPGDLRVTPNGRSYGDWMPQGVIIRHSKTTEQYIPPGRLPDRSEGDVDENPFDEAGLGTDAAGGADE